MQEYTIIFQTETLIDLYVIVEVSSLSLKTCFYNIVIAL